ncbi:UDP-glycosyltransferase [Arachis hypogaea]|nr:UDP-glycosyltransferase [Arachis hypogaea]
MFSLDSSPKPPGGRELSTVGPTNFLHTKGFHITFVNRVQPLAPPQIQRLQFSMPFQASILRPSQMAYLLPQSIPALCDSTSKNCFVPFSNLISKLNAASDSPPVTCIISDGVMTFTS